MMAIEGYCPVIFGIDDGGICSYICVDGPEQGIDE